MADDSVKVLLAKIGLDTSDWKSAFSDMQSKFQSFSTKVESESKSAVAQQKAGYDSLRDKIREQAVAQQEIRAQLAKATVEYGAQIAALKDINLSSADRAAKAAALSAELKEQTAQYKLQLNAVNAIKAGLTAQAARTALSLPKKESGESMLERTVGGFTKGGVLGLVEGVAGGTIIGDVAIEGIKKAVEALKEVNAEASRTAQLESALAAVTAGRVTNDEKLIQSMDKASSGMLTLDQLYKLATVSFENNAKITSSQLVQLTGAVVKLGVATNGPQGAAQAVNSMIQFMTSGRAQTLAQTLGLSRTAIAPTGSSGSINTPQAQQAQFEEAFKAITARAAALGPILDNAAASMQTITIAFSKIREVFLEDLQAAPGVEAVFRTFTELFAAMAVSIESDSDGMKKVADNVGAVFYSITRWLLVQVEGIQQFATAMGELLNVMFLVEDETIHFFTTIFDTIKNFIEHPIEASRGGRVNSNATNHFAQNIQQDKDRIAAARQALKNPQNSDIDKFIRQMDINYGKAQNEKEPNFKPYNANMAEDTTDTKAQNQLEQNQMLRLQIEQDTDAKVAAARLESLKNSLKTGVITEKDYSTQVVAIYREQFAQKKAFALAEEQEEIKKINADTGPQSTAAYKSAAIAGARLKAQKAINDAQYELNSQLTGQEEQDTAASRADALQGLKNTLDDRLQLISNAKDKAKADYESGKETANDYFNALKGFYQADIQAYTVYQAMRHAIGGVTPEEAEKEARQIQAQIAALKAQSNTLGTQNLTANNQLVQASFQSTMARLADEINSIQQNNTRIGASDYEKTAGSTIPSIIQNEITATQKYIVELESERDATAQGTMQRIKLNDEIEKSQKSLQGFQDQLDKLSTDGGALMLFASGITQIAGDLESGWGKFWSPISNAVSTIATNNKNPNFGFGAVWQTLSRGTTETIGASGIESTVSTNGVAGTLAALVNEMKPLAQGIGNLITAFQSTSPLQGATSGIAGGAEVGSMFTKLGGIFSIAGPVGAALGGVAGFISGIFQKAALQMAQNFATAMKKTMNNLQTQNITLAQAIAQLQQQEQQAIQQLSGQKGGQKQLGTLLPEYQQEIATLQAQAKQIMDSFQEQTNVLMLPEGQQSIATQINSIIDSYKQYVNAGGNVATANEYLQQSFANLEQSIGTTLNQDYQTAINDALQLNQLLQQRAQMESQELDQEHSILNQGVLQRSRTGAQTKAAQIDQLRYQLRQQQDQMDLEIQTEAAKVAAESQIFDLATTRIGLEQQLLQAQQAQTTLEMQQISQLQALLNQFYSSGVGSMITAALWNSLGAGISTSPAYPSRSIDLNKAVSGLRAARGRTGTYQTPLV